MEKDIMGYKISVIIPIYNTEKYISQCLDSVINQSLDNIEIICIDDGSTDCSRKIILDYQKNNGNIVLLIEENSGSGPARNNGLRSAQGEFVAFLDSDDYYPNNFVLENLYYSAKKNNVKICGGSVVQCWEGFENKLYQIEFMDVKKNQIIYYDNYQEICYYTRFIYNRKFLIDKKIFFPKLRRFQDPPFLFDAMIKAKKFYAIKDDVYVQRIDDKFIHYEDCQVVIDILRGINDLLKETLFNKMEKAYMNILNMLKKDSLIRFWAYFHVYNGKDEFLELFRNIEGNVSKEFCDKEKIHFEPFLNKAEIMEFIRDYNHDIKNLNKCVKLYQRIIIYGSADFAKITYYYLSLLKLDVEILFVETEIRYLHQIDGIVVKQVGELEVNNCEDLVIITGYKKDTQRFMYNNAMKLGFKNIENIQVYIASILINILESTSN